ncbi:hypothetical protein [Amycolatopsis sp. FDAARGOS 1241]|uniref:hypothetical protein n=1 Tax=Amycolatopsis sp. FDAARGOS 1241 TaxID=2778070 RepID=UPI0019512C90|nr:hypothetical protein [Amycolatopsis sp. FDAARGOS 1241]QRP45347.1 hypothetical protein I6J71_40385 [Amycolatopsis sp. FDAARGOS 1241]
MGSQDALAAMRAKLATLDAESTARAALLDLSRADAVAESKEKLEKQGKIQGEVFVRLQERNRRAKAAGGWATEKTVGDRYDDEGDFGFEEDETANERRAGFRTAEESGLTTGRRSAPDPAPAPAEPAGRHRRAAHAADDDGDFADTNWLAT